MSPRDPVPDTAEDQVPEDRALEEDPLEPDDDRPRLYLQSELEDPEEDLPPPEYSVKPEPVPPEAIPEARPEKKEKEKREKEPKERKQEKVAVLRVHHPQGHL